MIITAKYLGPTNTKGLRIKVSLERRAAKTYQWNCADHFGNYERAFTDYIRSELKIDGPIDHWTVAITPQGAIATNSCTKLGRGVML